MTEVPPGIPRAIAALDAALADEGIPWMLIGGVAAISRGLARLTDDVDATILGAEIDLSQ